MEGAINNIVEEYGNKYLILEENIENNWPIKFIEVDQDINFDKSNYSGREIISKVLPPINLIGRKAKFYKEQFSGFIDYNPKDS